jgi:DNA repair protein RecO (recombination protein O)
MKTYTTESVVLKKTNYSDADHIYTLYSKEYGKFTAIAKGVRKITSRRAGSLDTLNHIQVSIREDGHGFKYITEVKVVNSYHKVKLELAESNKCFYIIEVIQRYMEDHHENPEIFELLTSTLNGLNRKSIPSDLLISRFEIMFLKSNGYEMSFGHCTNCGRKLDSTWNTVSFNYELGSVICDNCNNLYGFGLDFDDAMTLHKLSSNKLGKDLSGVNISKISRLTKSMLTNTLGIKLKSLTLG